jgi:hypothetical protein
MSKEREGSKGLGLEEQEKSWERLDTAQRTAGHQEEHFHDFFFLVQSSDLLL